MTPKTNPPRPTYRRPAADAPRADVEDPLGAVRSGVDRLAFDLVRLCQSDGLEPAGALGLALEAVLAAALRAGAPEEARVQAAAFLMAESVAVLADGDRDLAHTLLADAVGDAADVLAESLAGPH